MTTAELLQEARDLITPRSKWIKGDWDNGHGAYCAVGALERIVGKHNISREVMAKAKITLHRVIPRGYGGIMGYNDSIRTSHECILTAFDAAIEQAKT